MTDQPPRQPSGPYRTEVSAVVKWFNRNKGFGFVKPEDGAPDAFLHASLVAQAGHDDLTAGSTLICDIAEGPRGPQVAAIHSVELAPEGAAPRGRPFRHGGHGPGAQGEVVEGRVKFYSVEKGFGFIIPDGGGKDVFVSARTLNRAGLAPLVAEQRVRVTTRMGDKGPMAAHIELLPDASP